MMIRLKLTRFLVLGAIGCLAATGCVHRRLTVRSNPAGATVYVDKQEIGRTPVSTPFTYYGTREIQLVRDGYEVVTQKEKIAAPWYQIPPLDFFAETFWPGEIRDERVVDFQMIPQQNVDPNEVAQRGQALRDQAQSGTAVPLLGAQATDANVSSGVVPFVAPQ